MRKCVFAGVALVLSIVVAACGGSNGQSAGSASSNNEAGSSKQYAELRWGMNTYPGRLNETTNVQYQTYEIESLAVQPLMEFEPDGKVKPGLASSVEQPNSTTYIYHLKSVKFSNGKPMTSADVVYSLDRNTIGKEAWTKSYFEDVASITAPDSSTVVVKLKRPLATFQKIIASMGIVIEKAAAEKSGEKEIGMPSHLPIGTGPWKFDSYTPEVSVQLSRNPYWTGPRQPAANIKIELFKTEASMALALRTGVLDGANYFAPKIFANIPGVRQQVTSGEDTVFAEVNVKQAPFSDVHVRRAMAYATDSKGMLDALFPSHDAVEAPLFVPNNMFQTLGTQAEVTQELASLPKFEFNLGKAKQELARSAYPHGFSTTIEVAEGQEAFVAAAQILVSDLAKIGIKVTIHEITKAEEERWATGKGVFDISETLAQYPDPETTYNEMLSPAQIYPRGGGGNVSRWTNSQFDKLLPEASETLNAPRRLRVIGDLVRVLRSEAPVWPLYSSQNFVALADSYVAPGFSFWTYNYARWAMDVKLAR